MANRSSHAVQQRILAFVASKPGREACRNSKVETVTTWMSKRLGVTEKTIIQELESLELARMVRLSRTEGGRRNIIKVTVLNGVEPEPWAVAEIEVNETENPDPEPEPVEAQDSLDYRKLADSLLLAAFEMLGTGDESKKKDQAIANLREEVENVRAQEQRTRSEMSLARAERDQAIGARRDLETQMRQITNQLHQEQARVRELESELARAKEKVDDANRRLREATVGAQVLEGLSERERAKVSSSLHDLVRGARR